MFVETKEFGEVTQAPAKTLKFSEAIRLGKPIVGEEDFDFALCAIGCAWAGVHGRVMTFDDRYRVSNQFPGVDKGAIRYALALGYPPQLCEEVSTMHCGGMQALEIAAKLEERGL